MEKILEKIDNNIELSLEEKRSIKRQIPEEQAPSDRIKNMDEVTKSYTPLQARLEASRCLSCKNPLCMKGCPVGINIPSFLKEVSKGNFKDAYKILSQKTFFPSICGRVCPQEVQCQKDCVLGKSLKDVNEAVSIGRIERFVGDYARENGFDKELLKERLKENQEERERNKDKKVAVIGSGPASLACAGKLANRGFQVTVFEALHELGGVLIYGIPEFRLPNKVVEREIEKLKELGVEFRTNFVVGRTASLDELMKEEGFEVIFLGTGAGLPIFMGIEGESLVGVFSANEFLTRVNLMGGYKDEAHTPVFKSKKVVVVGGGNVAMDASRVAKRLGADVTLVYRRTENEMPARKEEVAHAKEEGIEFLFLTNPKRILGDDKGKVTSIECLKYELGAPDASGRKSPVKIEGSEFEIQADTVIMALGNNPNPLISKTTEELNVDQKGRIIVDDNLQSSMKKVFAGGDIVLGSATVIKAMGMGCKVGDELDF